MKWVMLIFVAVIAYMVYTGNMGGAKKATGNYVDLRHNADPGVEPRPNLMHQMIKYNEDKEKK